MEANSIKECNGEGDECGDYKVHQCPYTKMFVAKHSSKKKLIETSFLLSWTKRMGLGLGRGFRVWSSAFCLRNVARFLRQP